MRTPAEQIIRVYITLMLLSTFASSFIWGINTLFLLDGGLSIAAAFTANASFTVAQVIFEIPTGVVADTWGRRISYLLGTITLMLSTLLYLLMWRMHAPLWGWIIASMLLGVGFTFFSGATEAWLVDGLKATNYKGTLEGAFAKGQIATGAAMLTGTFSGGFIAQLTNLGVPYVLRALTLGVTFVVAWLMMKDVGFKPRRSVSVAKEMRRILKASFDHGLRNPPVRWVMLAQPFVWGVAGYAFYAAQPYILQLYGNNRSYAIAGLAATIVAGAQIAGGFLMPKVRHLFRKRTTLLILGAVGNFVCLLAMGWLPHFWVVLGFLVLWAIIFSISLPVRQAFINDLIPSSERATVLSSDNLLSSAGGVVFQPPLGKSADAWGYPVSFIISGVIQLIALPFLFLAKRTKVKSDDMEEGAPIPVTNP